MEVMQPVVLLPIPLIVDGVTIPLVEVIALLPANAVNNSVKDSDVVTPGPPPGIV